MAVSWVLLCLSYSASNAQTIDYTTGNLINPSAWTGTNYGNLPGDCCTGGPSPLYNNQLGGGGISFSYGQATVSQNINLSQAIAGTGIVVRGYNYHWHVTTNSANGVDPVYGQVTLMSNTNTPLETFNYNYTTAMNETVFSGTQNFANNYSLAAVSSLNVSFTGRDQGFWAGYYGPSVNHIIVSMNYSVDPCATNPAYSPTCAGFNNVLSSTNLVPNPGGYAVSGYSIDQSYAINTALAAAGSNAMIHGFKWGYVANANGAYCNSWDLGIFGCLDFRTPSVSTNVNITNNTGASIYSVSRNYTNSYNTTEYSYLFPASRPMNTLGNFNFTASTNDQAYIGSMWSKAVYTADPCVNNPLYSPSCPGYGAAIVGNMNNTTTSATSTYTAPTTTSTTAAVASADPSVSAPTTTNVGGVELSTSGTISAPDGVPQVVKESQPAVASSSSASTPTASSSSSGGSKPSSLVMNAIKAVQDQNKANETRAIANAQAVVATSIMQSQETAATAIANINAISAASQQTSPIVTSQQQSSSLSGLSLTGRPGGQGISISTVNVSSVNNASMALSGIQPTSITYKYENRSNNDSTPTLPTSFTSRQDPLSSMMQPNELPQQLNFDQRNDTVKKNVQPNELAGGVDIGTMATVPVGFADYSFMMKDVAFYPPKEIYKNQKVVDNTRVLRQMSSDRLHQEMINLQYK